MTTISLGAKKFGTDLGMKAPAKRSTKHKIMAPTFPKALFTFLDFASLYRLLFVQSQYYWLSLHILST